MTECPKCNLPRDDTAWQCDGCGHEFSQDFEGVRSSLRAQLKQRRTALWVTVLANVALVGAIVFLALNGFIYVSLPLLLAVVGTTANAAHKLSVVREHLSSFDRRHAPRPRATGGTSHG